MLTLALIQLLSTHPLVCMNLTCSQEPSLCLPPAPAAVPSFQRPFTSSPQAPGGLCAPGGRLAYRHQLPAGLLWPAWAAFGAGGCHRAPCPVSVGVRVVVVKLRQEQVVSCSKRSGVETF